MQKALMRPDIKGVLAWLIRFSLPLILSGILQQLYSWADAFIVGNVEGMTALAAVGSTTAVVNFFVSVITGFTLGLGVLFAQKYGAGATDALHRLLGCFAMVLGGVFVAVALLGAGFTYAILRLVDTGADTIEYAHAYLSVVFAGMPFLAVYNVYSAALRGLGNTKAPFYAVVLSCIMNVALDFLLVGYLRFGVAGAAWATVVSQCSMTIFIVLYTVRRYPELRFTVSPRLLSRTILQEGCAFGVPPMIQSSLTSFGSLILQRFMNGFGSSTVAAITTAYRVDSVILLPIFNLGSAISTLTAQRIGAGDRRTPRVVLFTGGILMGVVSVLMTGLVLLVSRPLISIFGVDQQALAIGTMFFDQLAPFYVVFGIATAMRGYLEGIADLVYSSAMGVLCLVFRIVCSYTLDDVFQEGIFAYAEAISWILLLLLYLLRTVWNLRKQKAGDAARLES